MTSSLLADFFAASLLTLVMPAALVLGVAVYVALLMRRGSQRSGK